MTSVDHSERTVCDVLIVGAGPTGLALATMLARSGVAAVIVDKLARGQNTSRAAVIHAHTLEVLDEIGVSERLAREGLRLARFSLRDRDRVLLRLRFDALPTPHNYLLMLPQDATERILAEALVEAGGAVRWGCTVASLAETPQGVRASVASSDGRGEIEARFVVGADGMHSLVRQVAGIAFAGGSYEESFVLADVEMAWNHPEEVTLFFSPAGVLVVAPLPGSAYRIVATLDDAPERPGVADVQALLDARGPHAPGRVSKVRWSSRFRVHHRLAERYRSGRFFLMGDAAHVHSPAGGQGMNTGLVDAVVLGRLLRDVLTGRADEGDLTRYESLRRPAARQVLQLAGLLMHLAIIEGAPRRALRNVALRTLGLSPVFRRRLAMDFSGLSRRAAALSASETARPGRVS
jgi:2-polyprenyl-6-methoxyphenol hydroxylase-like FAD-dependent oxidoreductase